MNRVAEAHIRTIDCVVGLDADNKVIAFVRHPKLPPFIDVRDDVEATWLSDRLVITSGRESKDFPYKVWSSLQPESPLYKYFNSLIRSDYVAPQQFVYF